MATLITLRGRFAAATGGPGVGTLAAVLNTQPGLHDVSSAADSLRAKQGVTLDGFGQFSVSLPATTDPTSNPHGALYIIVETITVNSLTRTRTYSIPLPHDIPGGVVELAALAPPADAALGYTLLPTVSLTALDQLVYPGWDGQAGAVATAFHPDGSIVETVGGAAVPVTTTFAPNGNITTALGAPINRTRTAVFNADGSVLETVT